MAKVSKPNKSGLQYSVVAPNPNVNDGRSGPALPANGSKRKRAQSAKVHKSGVFPQQQ